MNTSCDDPTCPCRDDHSGCAGALHDAFARIGWDVVVSTAAPLVRGLFTLTEPMVCPHGVAHWAEPTGEQLVALGERRQRQQP